MSRSSLYNFKLNRYANINEYLKLQGFLQNFKIKVSHNQFKKQLGNSMSVNVLINIYIQIFKSIKNID